MPQIDVLCLGGIIYHESVENGTMAKIQGHRGIVVKNKKVEEFSPTSFFILGCL